MLIKMMDRFNDAIIEWHPSKRVDTCEQFIVQIQSSFIFQIESIPFIHLLHTTMADIERGGKRERDRV